jgi:transcriptional regulator with XRE-family HTH domain
MPDKKPTPHAERGKRLRRRRKELEESGAIPADLAKLAALVPVSVSGFQQWERGETWPRDKKRARLADLMGWSETELDHGPQEAKGQPDMASHPVSPDELEMLAIYRGLEDQRGEAKRWLLSKLHTRHALQQEVRGPLKAATDQRVEQYIPSRPSRSKRPTK